MKSRNACAMPGGVPPRLLVALAVLALASGGAVADRLAPDSVAGVGNNINVWPTGDPALDVSDVQWAVDNVRAGGVVRLKGHDKFTGLPARFEFGDGSVTVTKSVSVKGDVDDSGSLLATIGGGNKPFVCDDPSIVLEISNLRFDGARRAAIYVRQSAAVRIAGNVMINLKPSSNPEPGYPIPGVRYFAASAIEMGLLVCETPDPGGTAACLDAPRQLGLVEISNNYIDLGIYDSAGKLADPVKQYPNFKADGTPLDDTSFSGIVIVDAELSAKISGNTIRNTNRRAIHPLDTFGTTETVGNAIEMAPFSSAAPGAASSGGNGKRNYGFLAINGHRNVLAATAGATHKVTHNIVIAASDFGSDGPHGQAIVAANGVSDTLFSENLIIYRSGARNAFAIGGGSSLVKPTRVKYTTIRRNTIDASAFVPVPNPPGYPISAHIAASAADSTTIDSNTYVHPDVVPPVLPTYVIFGTLTGFLDDSPNTIVDTYCGTTKISFANLGSCTQP